MNTNIWIWTVALGLLTKTVLTMFGLGIDMLGSSSPHVVTWLLYKFTGVAALAVAVGIPALLVKPFLEDGPAVNRPPLFTLVVVTALCGAATAAFQCLAFAPLYLLKVRLGGFLLSVGGLLASSYAVWRVARLHADPEGELSAGLLAGIGGLLLLVGAPLTGIFCLVLAGFSAYQG